MSCNYIRSELRLLAEAVAECGVMPVSGCEFLTQHGQAMSPRIDAVNPSRGSHCPRLPGSRCPHHKPLQLYRPTPKVLLQLHACVRSKCLLWPLHRHMHASGEVYSFGMSLRGCCAVCHMLSDPKLVLRRRHMRTPAARFMAAACHWAAMYRCACVARSSESSHLHVVYFLYLYLHLYRYAICIWISLLHL